MPTLGEDSVIRFGEGTADNYNFKTTDTDGNDKYYTINLNTDKMTTVPDKVQWSDTDSGSSTGHVNVKLPYNDTTDGQTKTYYYTTNGASSARINNTLSQSITNEVFYGKNVTSLYSYPYGGAIYNSGSHSDVSINADFIGNYASSSSSSSYGGAILNIGTIGKKENGVVTGGIINSNFIGNYASSSSSSYGGAIYNNNGGTIGDITGDFIGNYASSSSSYGGAISNNNGGTIGDITGDFIGNYASSSSYSGGGAIYNYNNGTIGDITGNFIGNYIKSPNSSSYGGAILNGLGTIGKKENGVVTGGIINSNFIGNYAKTTESSGTAQGGAIWTNSDLNIIADNGSSTFKDNYVQKGDGEKDYQAIWVDSNSANLNLIQRNGGKMYMYDNINGKDGYKVNIQGDGTGTYYMLNDIKNANVSFDNTTVNTVNNQIHTYDFNSFNLKSNTNFVADVDLQNEQMDRITSNSYTVADGAKLTVSGMNLLNDATKDDTKILFAQKDLAQNVDTTVTQVAYSPIYKYDVNYLVDNDNQQGYFTFARHATDAGSNSYENYNPTIFDGAVSTSAVI